MEERLAHQEQKIQTELRDDKENAARKISQYKKALEEEREKGWRERLWERG